MDYFKDIIGQEKAIKFLQNSLETGNISHAYLFQGPPGTGKIATARAFAAALLNAGDREAEIFLKNGMHPDLMVIKKPEKRNVVGKEQISGEMVPWLAVKPYRAGCKLVIIDEAESMSLEAANALLKTLEEPPAYATIILVANQLEMMETILSRCQVVKFYPLTDEQVESLLIKEGVSAQEAGQAARLAQGSPGNALRFVRENNIKENWSNVRLAVKGFTQGHYRSVFETAGMMESDPYLVTGMLELVLRDIYIYQQTGREQLLAIPENVDMIKSIPSKSPGKLQMALQRIAGLKNYYRSNVNPLLLNTEIGYAMLEALK